MKDTAIDVDDGVIRGRDRATAVSSTVFKRLKIADLNGVSTSNGDSTADSFAEILIQQAFLYVHRRTEEVDATARNETGIEQKRRITKVEEPT